MAAVPYAARHACAPPEAVCVGRASCGRGYGRHVGPSGVAPLNVLATGTLIDASVVRRSLRAISMETLIDDSTLACRARFELLFVVALGVSLVGPGCARPNVLVGYAYGPICIYCTGDCRACRPRGVWDGAERAPPPLNLAGVKGGARPPDLADLARQLSHEARAS